MSHEIYITGEIRKHEEAIARLRSLRLFAQRVIDDAVAAEASKPTSSDETWERLRRWVESEMESLGMIRVVADPCGHGGTEIGRPKHWAQAKIV